MYGRGMMSIIVACVVIFVATGCSVYYPTSYRAFIPKQWDSEYKEYQRLCKEEIGKVVYARPVGEDVKLEDMLRLYDVTKIGDSVSVSIAGIKVRHKEYYYLYIEGFRYYTNWTKLSLSMHDNPRQYIKCEPFLFGQNSKKEYSMFREDEVERISREESAIAKKIAFNNKEYIGGDEILKEYIAIQHFSYDLRRMYISPILKDAVYTKNYHYINQQESK